MGNQSVREIVARREMLQAVITQAHKDNVIPTESFLIKAMREKGYKTYSTATFYRDKTEINKENTFVKDLVESNYSAVVEENIKLLDKMQEKLVEYLTKPPEIVRSYYNMIPNPTFNPKLEESKTNLRLIPEFREQMREPIPVTQIIKMIQDCANLKLRVLNGDIIDVGVALANQKFKEFENVIEQQKLRIMDLEEELKNGKTNQE